MTELGKQFANNRLKTYLRGRIHLTDITENYKKDLNLSLVEKTNGNESKTTTYSSAYSIESIPLQVFKAYDPDDWEVKISDDGAISFCYSDQHSLSAIAAVDYAMRETKPSCGLVKEFKIISK